MEIEGCAMIIQRRFDTKEERNAEYRRLKDLGTKHLVKFTTSVSEQHGVQVKGKIIWMIALPIQ